MASRQAIRRVIKDVFGTGQKQQRSKAGFKTSGFDVLARTQTGPYDKRYFIGPGIGPSARRAMPEGYFFKYTSEQEQRRLDKLGQLRRRGKGPPKKGSGKRASKK